MSAAMLSHLTVVELTEGLGAYTGRILAELGARVIKVEPPGGDPARARGPRDPKLDASFDWLARNAGKEGVTLDPASPPDRARLRELVAGADILVQGGFDRLVGLGMTYETLSAVSPGLISVIVAPFAEGTLYGEAAPACDLTLMAMSGIVNMVGDPDRPPLKLPGEQAYALAGIQGAIAALMALNARAADGRGQRVWVSAYQSAVLAGYRDPIVWEWTGRIGQRTGNRLVRGKSGVRQVWASLDGFVTWSLVDNPGMIKGMIALMDADDAAGDLAAVDWDNRLVADEAQARIEAWEAQLEAWFATKTKAELARLSAEHGLGLSQIDTPEDALSGAQWAARGFWRRLKDPDRGLDLPLPGPLFRSSAIEPTDPAPAPILQHAEAEA